MADPANMVGAPSGVPLPGSTPSTGQPAVPIAGPGPEKRIALPKTLWDRVWRNYQILTLESINDDNAADVISAYNALRAEVFSKMLEG